MVAHQTGAHHRAVSGRRHCGFDGPHGDRQAGRRFGAGGDCGGPHRRGRQHWHRRGGQGRARWPHFAAGHHLACDAAGFWPLALAPHARLCRCGHAGAGAQPGGGAVHAGPQNVARVCRLRQGQPQPNQLCERRQWHVANPGYPEIAKNHRHPVDQCGLQRLPAGHAGFDERPGAVFDGAFWRGCAARQVGQAAGTGDCRAIAQPAVPRCADHCRGRVPGRTGDLLVRLAGPGRHTQSGH